MLSKRQIGIVKVASELLTREGITGVTIKNLAEKVGFSEAALYRHFKSKEEILIKSLVYLADSMKKRFAEIDPFLNYQEQLEATLRSQLQFFRENPFYVVPFDAEGLYANNKLLNAEILKLDEIKKEHLRSIFEFGQKKGEFTHSVSPEFLVDLVIGVFSRYMFKWRVSEFAFDLTETGNQLISDLLLIIKTK